MDHESPDAPVVYIVDDDASVGRALGRLLRSYGLRSMAFGSAAQLLAGERWRGAACFLIDVRMPRMTGFELAERLVTAGATAPVILMSAHAETSGAGSNAIALLRKPLDDRLLIDTLREALELRSKKKNKRRT